MAWKRIKCIVTGCGASPQNSPDRKFHKFPKRDSDLYTLWCKAVNVSVEKKCRYICSHHFEAGDYAKSFLKRNAFPRFHLGGNDETSSLESFDPQKAIKTYERINYNNDLTFNTLDELSKVGQTLPSEDPLKAIAGPKPG